MITLFFDLMGTLGGDGMGDFSSFQWYEGAKEALVMAKEHGCKNIIITNQSRIGKGLVSEEDFTKWTEEWLASINKNGIVVDGFYTCPHVREDNCSCKKPKAGMVEQALLDHVDIDKTKAYIIGDMGKSDMLLAKNLGVKGILVLTGVGEGSLSTFRDTWKDFDPCFVANNVDHAVRWVLNKL